MSGCEAQRLIALSLGKIALSRQQRGGINLHKNLLVATVLHKARTTYMMDNFQTLIANRKAQAEREAAAKMVVEAPIVVENQMDNNTDSTSDSNDEQVVPCSRGVTDSENRVNGIEVPSGERPDAVSSSSDKENSTPKYDNIGSTDNNSNPLICDETLNNVSSTNNNNNKRLCDRDVPLVTGKLPLSLHNVDSEQNQLSSCRCSGGGNGKRRRSCMDFCDAVTQAKRARLAEDYDSCESDSESEFDPVDATDYENMQTEPTQVTNLVDIFNSGFSGLYTKDAHEQSSDNGNTGHTGQINVYVSADRPLNGSQFMLKDVSCAKQMKENVAIPTAIALAV